MEPNILNRWPLRLLFAPKLLMLFARVPFKPPPPGFQQKEGKKYTPNRDGGVGEGIASSGLKKP